MITFQSRDYDLSVSVERLPIRFQDSTSVGRIRWEVTFRVYPDGGTLHQSDDLQTPSTARETEALQSVASFLAAYVEAQDYPESENRDLFPGLAEACEVRDLDLASFADSLYLECEEG